MLKTIIALAVVATGLTALAISPTTAQEKMRACYVGQKVLMPGGHPGTVSAVYGQGGCTVRDEKFLESSWAAFMLTPAPGSPVRNPPPVGATPAPGDYQCYGGSAGNMKLRFFAGNAYANEQGSRGSYKLRPSGQMEFISGPWAGFYAKSLETGKVGLTSKADGTFYQMTCDKR